MLMSKTTLAVGLAVASLIVPQASGGQERQRVDAHMHTTAENRIRGGVPICIGTLDPERGGLLPFDPDDPRWEACSRIEMSVRSRAELMARTRELYERYNVVAAVGSDVTAEAALDWQVSVPYVVVPGWGFTPGRVPVDSVREVLSDGKVRFLGEFSWQYQGISPADSVVEPYLALAEDLDLPVGTHMGPGFPGGAVQASPNYRGRLGDPALWEEPLARHPNLRVVIQHAGWPWLESTLSLLFSYPNVYVDLGQIAFLLPRAEFHRYLEALVTAGFEKRVMWGSDGFLWPNAIEISIEAIESAPFLTEEAKQAIFYDNAVRFYRLADLLEPDR